MTHTIFVAAGDHDSESIEIGSSETTDSSITFYSYWNRAGDAPAEPYGVRKKVYIVSVKGQFILSSSQIYIEATKRGKFEHKGMEYLFIKAKTPAQQKLLNSYLSETEKTYNGKFVLGESSKNLLQEVKQKLQKQIKEHTAHWKVTYSNSFGGYTL